MLNFVVLWLGMSGGSFLASECRYEPAPAITSRDIAKGGDVDFRPLWNRLLHMMDVRR